MTLYRETPCEHGEIDRHAHSDCQHRYKGIRVHAQCICLGGTRTRVAVDYRAAAKEIGSIVRGYVMWRGHQHKHVGVDEGLEGQWAGRILGTAIRETE